MKENRITTGNPKAFTFFWKETEANGYLSQWYPREFVVEGIRYICCEQYMMAKKALLFKDTRTYNKIMATTDPGTIKYLGKQVKPYDDEVWNAAAKEVILHANLAKFSQNADLKKMLLGTGDTILAEASPFDGKYGIKLAVSDPRALDPNQWLGTNWLGETLMKVRKYLRIMN